MPENGRAVFEEALEDPHEAAYRVGAVDGRTLADKTRRPWRLGG